MSSEVAFFAMVRALLPGSGDSGASRALGASPGDKDGGVGESVLDDILDDLAGGGGDGGCCCCYCCWLSCDDELGPPHLVRVRTRATKDDPNMGRLLRDKAHQRRIQHRLLLLAQHTLHLE